MSLKTFARSCALSALVLMPVASYADFAGVSVGGGFWNHDPSGTIKNGGDNISLSNDLGLSGDTQKFLWVAIEHPVPLIPNIKLKMTEFDISGATTLNQNITFGDKTFTSGTNISSIANMNQYDLAFYYEILDNWVNLDLGANLKFIDGDFTIKSSGQSETGDFTGVVPLLYANARFDLPLTGLSIGVEGSGAAYSGNRIYDIEAKARYEISFGLGAEAAAGIEAGWREQGLKIDVGDIGSDLKVGGPFAGLYVRASLF